MMGIGHSIGNSVLGNLYWLILIGHPIGHPVLGILYWASCIIGHPINGQYHAVNIYGTTLPHWKNYNDQAYRCPRDVKWCLRHHGGTIEPPPCTLRIKLHPIVTRDASLSVSKTPAILVHKKCVKITLDDYTFAV